MEPFKEKVWLSSPTMHGEELKYMQEVFEINSKFTGGQNRNEVERIAAGKIGRKYAVALSSGTTALNLAMKLVLIKPGDKVFCSDIKLHAKDKQIVENRQKSA